MNPQDAHPPTAHPALDCYDFIVAPNPLFKEPETEMDKVFAQLAAIRADLRDLMHLVNVMHAANLH